MSKSIKSLAVILTVAAANLASVGCVIVAEPTYTYPTGQADYFVEVTETVIDDYGYESDAYCSGTTRFSGYIDDRCTVAGYYPMVWSFSRNDYLDCYYIDYWGYENYYSGEFAFPEGYVAESDCDGYYYGSEGSDSDGGPAAGEAPELVPAAPTSSPIRGAVAGTTLARDAQGRVKVASIGGNVTSGVRALRAIMLGGEHAPATTIPNTSDALLRLPLGNVVLDAPAAE